MLPPAYLQVGRGPVQHSRDDVVEKLYAAVVKAARAPDFVAKVQARVKAAVVAR